MLEVSIVDGRPAVRGELDMQTAPALKAWLDQLDGQATEVDLSGVTFFDSLTLRIFLLARKQHPSFRVVNASDAVVKVLVMTDTVAYLVGHPEPGR